MNGICTASNIVSVAHAAIRSLRVSADPLDKARFVFAGAALYCFWHLPIAGLIAQAAIHILFDGLQYIPTSNDKVGLLANLFFKEAGFPFQMAKRLHELVAPFIVSAQWMSFKTGADYFKIFNEKVLQEKKIGLAELKPIDLSLDDEPIDALAVIHNPLSKRWILVSGGSSEIYQRRLMSAQDYSWKEIMPDRWRLAEKIDANVLFFNYPGCGLSGGMTSRTQMVATHRALQEYLENERGALEIVCYGFSIGGGVQAEAMAGYEPKDGVSYLLIKDRTFTTLSAAAYDLLGMWAAYGASLAGWNINGLKDSHFPQIILQRGESDSSIFDGIISSESALASKASVGQEVVWLDSGDHESPLEPPLIDQIASQVLDQLQAPVQAA